MKKSLAKFRLLLEKGGCEVEDIRFFFGGKLVCIGFRATNPANKRYVEVTPQYRNIWMVNSYSYVFDMGDIRCQHYAMKREGFYPSFCRPYSLMKKEIIEALKMDARNIWKTKAGKHRLFSVLHNKHFDFDTVEEADTFRDYLIEAEGWFKRPTLKNVEERRLFCQKENLDLPIKVK